jgi:SAM-dependent methyltransferase
MGIDRSRRVTFEEVADLYSESRPGYPEELVEDVIRWSGLGVNGRILEIGCGPGNATHLFARHGYHLLGIELGQKLAQYARQRCAAFPYTVIVTAAFEEYELPPHSFDLAISADAFHWIPPEIGYPKLMNALKPGGAMALFWHVPVDPQTEWSRAIDDAFQQYAPEFENPHHSFSLAWLEEIIRGNFRNYCGLEAVTVKPYNWSEVVDVETFIKQLRTYSSLWDMDAETRAALDTGVRDVFRQYDGRIAKPYQVALFHTMVSDN